LKVLVTGGFGFIGSNLVKKLYEEDYTIDIVDDLSSGNFDSLKEYKIRKSMAQIMHNLDETGRDFIRFFHCDFAFSGILEKVASGNYDCIFHLAAIPRVSFSVENPAETTEVNLMNTVKLFDAARIGKTRVIFSSSSSVYGGAEIMPTPESAIKKPKSPYAWQKSGCENIAKVYGSLYDDSDIVSLRYFNVFGPGQYGDSPYSTAVSAWCHATKNGLSCRSDGDGTQSRDMCYVDNVVDANILASKVKEKWRGQCFNIACSDSVTNGEILTYFIDNFGSKVHTAPWRQGDVMHTCADITRAQEAFGYVPKVRFWEGLEKTVKWWGLK
tara:strand:+ start:403 stop:1383 length:981 start_codon:yes stop_codon:yes gene_type:complete